MYEMQVKIETRDASGKPIKEWRSVRPTGGQPYRYETYEEARHMLDMCYPQVINEEKRILEVQQ